MPKKCHPLAQIWSGTYWKTYFRPRNRSGSHIGFAESVDGSPRFLCMVLNEPISRQLSLFSHVVVGARGWGSTFFFFYNWGCTPASENISIGKIHDERYNNFIRLKIEWNTHTYPTNCGIYQLLCLQYKMQVRSLLGIFPNITTLCEDRKLDHGFGWSQW